MGKATAKARPTKKAKGKANAETGGPVRPVHGISRSELPAYRKLLSVFCDRLPVSHRYQCEVPFVQGGWLCATDGRIAVRVAAPGVADDKPTRSVNGKLLQFPPVGSGALSVFGSGYDPASCTRTLDAAELEAAGKAGGETSCFDCGETGREHKTCQECKGIGCKKCDDEGWTLTGKGCPTCNGNGFVPKLRIAGRLVNSTFIHRLIDLAVTVGGEMLFNRDKEKPTYWQKDNALKVLVRRVEVKGSAGREKVRVVELQALVMPLSR